jgi:hypothetical protein
VGRAEEEAEARVALEWRLAAMNNASSARGGGNSSSAVAAAAVAEVTSLNAQLERRAVRAEVG